MSKLKSDFAVDNTRLRMEIHELEVIANKYKELWKSAGFVHTANIARITKRHAIICTVVAVAAFLIGLMF